MQCKHKSTQILNTRLYEFDALDILLLDPFVERLELKWEEGIWVNAIPLFVAELCSCLIMIWPFLSSIPRVQQPFFARREAAG